MPKEIPIALGNVLKVKMDQQSLTGWLLILAPHLSSGVSLGIFVGFDNVAATSFKNLGL